MTTHFRNRDASDLSRLLSPDMWEQLSEMAQRGGDLSPDWLMRVVKRTVPHADYAGVMLIRPQVRPITLACIDDEPAHVDRLQHRLKQGPCLQASHGFNVVISGDLGTDRRWPRFATVCGPRTVIRSVLSAPLQLAGDDRGALNIYSTDRNAFCDADVPLATLAASFVALGVVRSLHQHDVEHLTAALESNRVISRAVGILMATRHLTPEEAFHHLRQASGVTNRKVRELAEIVEHQGDLPTVPTAAAR